MDPLSCRVLHTNGMLVMLYRLLIFIENLAVGSDHIVTFFGNFKLCPTDRQDFFCMVLSQFSCVCIPYDGAALDAARKRKEDTYPELTGENGRRLVVLAAEIGGRWSGEIAQFLCALATARAQSVPLNLQGRMEAAWLRRWSAILA